MKKLVLFILVIIISIDTLFPQNYKRDGDALAAEKNYAGAAAMYELCMQQDEDCLFSYFKLIYDGNIKSQFSDDLFNLIFPLADKGRASAQFFLGYMYRSGLGVEQNYKEAVKWYQKSADQGNATAQNNLGFMYQYGYGVTQDYKEALKWYLKSANQEYAIAQNNLGDLYYNGYGVTKDYKEAIKWFQKSAEQGNASAQNNMGNMYENGYGVTADRQKAIEWYEKSAAQGNQTAKNNIERLKATMPSTVGNPSITIVNNTGYTVKIVNVSPIADGKWGPNRLASNQTLDNGQSFTLQLPHPINVVNRYDIMLTDTDDDTYTQENVLVSAGDKIEFTFDDIDEDEDSTSSLSWHDILKKAISANSKPLDNDFYKGQDRTNGMGVYLWNEGDIYFGSFKDNRRNGYGVYMIRTSFKDSPGCKYYVGNYSNGLQNGIGACYDSNGKFLYRGIYKDGKPQGTYPSVGNYSSLKFDMLDHYGNGDIYKGETKDGVRHGYGIYVFQNGDMWLGEWRDDNRTGNGIRIRNNGTVEPGNR